MIKKLFGETKEEQYRYLKPRILALCVGVVLMLLGVLLIEINLPVGEQIEWLGEITFAICCLVFGWSIMRGFFGIVTVGALFSNNLVIGVVIFVLYIVVGYFAGMVVAVIGICRFLSLLKERKR